MCGIVGIVRRRGFDPSDPKRLRAMADAVVHRGPDDFGYLALNSADGRFTLGHDVAGDGPREVLLGSRRLSIIDLSSAGRQPMANARGDVFLVFNGEIYNHVEVRRELAARGRRFRSESDTEVLLQAYEEWGERCVDRFNGMWAFAVWDQRRRRLFCSRDRFGVKPFYYLLDDDVFLFGSEIKAILMASSGAAAPHYPTIAAFLARGALCQTADTFFDRIVRLPAAHNLVVSRDRSELTRYWDYTTRSHPYDLRRPEETFAELLDDAVRLRLRSDVPVGVALSGGVDSTAITALARRHRGGAPLHVFHSEFPGRPYDERRYAELVATQLGVELHVAEYRPASIVEDLERVVWHMDYPALVAQVLPRWQLMELAARHVKVVLEGQGSDEMLAGYPYLHFAPYVLDEIGRLTPRNLWSTLRGVGAASVETYRRWGRQPFRAFAGGVAPLRRLRRALGVDDGVLTAELRASTAQWPDPAPGGQLFHDRLDRALHAHHSRTILPHLLKFGDAISMAHSVESRLPFLDYRVVELVFQLEAHDKFDGVESKIVMKRALRDVLPAPIAARKDKIGFATPLQSWLRQFMEAEIRPLLLSDRARRRGIVDPVRMEAALTRVARGDGVPSGLVFRCLSLEIWFRLFVDAVHASPDRRETSPAARAGTRDQRSRLGLSPGPAT